MKNFELFMGYLGNGCTVCNSAVQVNGDYKRIAHISPAGNITWYVPVTSIPGDALLKIEHTAHAHESNTRARLRVELASRYGYARVLDEIGTYTPYNAWNELFSALKAEADQDVKNTIIENYYIKHF